MLCIPLTNGLTENLVPGERSSSPQHSVCECHFCVTKYRTGLLQITQVSSVLPLQKHLESGRAKAGAPLRIQHCLTINVSHQCFTVSPSFCACVNFTGPVLHPALQGKCHVSVEGPGTFRVYSQPCK